MTEKSIKVFPAILFFVLISLKTAGAEPLIKPVDIKNTHILYISHLFNPVEGSSVLENGSNDFGINIIQSNSIIDIYQFEKHGKQGSIDLETTTLLLNYKRKIDDRTEIKGALPFYYHGGGFMDKYIENFHKAFPGKGLKNGGREFGGNNEIHIQYQTALGGPDINRPFYGLGDPSLFLKRIIYNGNPGVTCSLGVKPRVGDKAFINSNTTDTGISINADYRYGIVNLYAMAGYSYFYGRGIYKNELEQNRDYLLSTAAGAGVLITDTLYLSIQFYIHNSMYKTGIKKIDYPTTINSYSLRWKPYNQFVIQFCIDEDPITYAGVDIAFSLRFEHTF